MNEDDSLNGCRWNIQGICEGVDICRVIMLVLIKVVMNILMNLVIQM